LDLISSKIWKFDCITNKELGCFCKSSFYSKCNGTAIYYLYIKYAELILRIYLFLISFYLQLIWIIKGSMFIYLLSKKYFKFYIDLQLSNLCMIIYKDLDLKQN